MTTCAITTCGREIAGTSEDVLVCVDHGDDVVEIMCFACARRENPHHAFNVPSVWTIARLTGDRTGLDRLEEQGRATRAKFEQRLAARRGR